MKNHIEQKIGKINQDLEKLKKEEKSIEEKILVKLNELLKYYKLLDKYRKD